MAKTKTLRQPLNSEEAAILHEVHKDPFLFSRFVHCVHPLRGKVKFELYPYQVAVLWHFLYNRFNIIKKFRQGGITELIAMYCLWLAMYHNHKTIVIISIKDRVAKKVLKRIKFMYNNLPAYLKVPVINGRGSDIGTATDLEFCNGSVISSIPTTEDAGRSDAVSLMVIDEAAIVRWANTIWASAFPTLSTGGAAIVNSCVTGDTNIITKNGPIRIDTICPQSFGKLDISLLGLEVLTHTGKYKKILGSVNKGLLETWEIKNQRGEVLKCTPDHKLLTISGWMSVRDIIAKGKKAIFYNLAAKENPPITQPPLLEVLKQVEGFPRYYVSNWGRVFIKTSAGEMVEKKGSINNWGYVSIKLWHNKRGKKVSRNRLVAEYFLGEIPPGYLVDHINCNKQDDYVTNLQIITPQENSKRGATYSNNHSLGASRQSGALSNLQQVAYIQREYKKHKKANTKDFHSLIIKSCKDKFGTTPNKSYITRIGTLKRCSKVYTSTLQLIRKYTDTIYDISVEEDKSYLTDSHYINHNTPYGIGNFYHQTWVEACNGTNGFNPINLKWTMHPERDIKWYLEQRNILGARRTAQEIDGDFLTSGSTVFNLADIRAIEEALIDYPAIETRFGGNLRIYKKPQKGEQYFIGSDISTGTSRDYSAFSVMNTQGEEYASFKGKIKVTALADLLMSLGSEYNYATLAPESNDIGLAVTSKIEEQRYKNLYYSTRFLKEKGQRKHKEENIAGWYTTSKNRPVIINALEEDIRYDNIIIKDPFFVQEAYTFIYDENNKPIALGKNRRGQDDGIEDDSNTYHDDSILGKSITNHIRKGRIKSPIILPQ